MHGRGQRAAPPLLSLLNFDTDDEGGGGCRIALEERK
jgi:hypothetical protein